MERELQEKENKEITIFKKTKLCDTIIISQSEEWFSTKTDCFSTFSLDFQANGLNRTTNALFFIFEMTIGMEPHFVAVLITVYFKMHSSAAIE